ncbi:hypothetical protein AXF42_Ash018964 [Apostasia shenzhenica]|uniref:Uncharacterized protein n=1 Tax=Apostasia shenzhenica TaxID=1088818 RepID=A0A2I0B4N3_9ASPA|nr:hypothetical protein AXF42_Ash018964 [Apostasia shenzhenica]
MEAGATVRSKPSPRVTARKPAETIAGLHRIDGLVAAFGMSNPGWDVSNVGMRDPLPGPVYFHLPRHFFAFCLWLWDLLHHVLPTMLRAD